MNIKEWEARCVLPIFSTGDNMFELQGNLKFVNVDIDYVKKLHTACSEVYYMPNEYENKPCIGILVSQGGYKYVLPMTSAKSKHKKWKNSDRDRMLVYEMVDVNELSSKDIWVKVDDTNVVKHIMSAIDIKKMIPVTDEVISIVNINHNDNDTDIENKYKDLLNKEYSFCLKIIDDLIKKASRIYEKQMRIGKVEMFACDFKALEQVADAESK